MTTNPVLMQVFKNRFAAIAEEMGVTLNRTAFSPQHQGTPRFFLRPSSIKTAT